MAACCCCRSWLIVVFFHFRNLLSWFVVASSVSACWTKTALDTAATCRLCATMLSSWLPFASGIHHSPIRAIFDSEDCCVWRIRDHHRAPLDSYAHHSAPMPTSVPTHHSPPVPTIRLQHPPLKSSIICYQSRIRREIVVFDGSSNHHRASLGSDAHHSAATPTTRLQRPSLGSDANHLPPAPTTRLQRPPLRSDTQYLFQAPTTRLQCPPLGSDTHQSTPALIIRL